MSKPTIKVDRVEAPQAPTSLALWQQVAAQEARMEPGGVWEFRYTLADGSPMLALHCAWTEAERADYGATLQAAIQNTVSAGTPAQSFRFLDTPTGRFYRILYGL